MINFSEWLKENTGLGDSSIYKYSHGACTISKGMLKCGVISKPLEEMSPVELDVAIFLILSDESFIQKNKKGNSMYSTEIHGYKPVAFFNCVRGVLLCVETPGNTLGDETKDLTGTSWIIVEEILPRGKTLSVTILESRLSSSVIR